MPFITLLIINHEMIIHRQDRVDMSIMVEEYGYLAAVGLGTQYIHSLDMLFYLSRIEARNGNDQIAFLSLLPWSGQP